MRRVVITGMGIWSSIGQDLQSVTESLRLGRSGIIYDQSRVDYGYQSGLVGNVPKPDLKPFLSRHERMMMSDDAAYSFMSARQAFEQAGIDKDYLYHTDVGIIWGSEGNSHQQEYIRVIEETHSTALVGSNAMIRSAASSVVMNLATIFHLQGINMSISSACASASHAICTAFMHITQGMEDVILVGGSGNINKESVGGMVIDALCKDDCYNDNPTAGSRPFDERAVGEILSGGAAALVVEEYEHAISRGANILAEIKTYAIASGHTQDIYVADWTAEQNAIKKALKNANISPNEIELVHTFASSDRHVDWIEAKSLSGIFSDIDTSICATATITGHEDAMSGASGIIYTILMMKNGFIAPHINLENPIIEVQHLNIPRLTQFRDIKNAIITSAGLGGNYIAIIISNVND